MLAVNCQPPQNCTPKEEFFEVVDFNIKTDVFWSFYLKLTWNDWDTHTYMYVSTLKLISNNGKISFWVLCQAFVQSTLYIWAHVIFQYSWCSFCFIVYLRDKKRHTEVRWLGLVSLLSGRAWAFTSWVLCIELILIEWLISINY